MALSPVGAPAVAVHDRLDAAEVRLPGESWVLVDGDVTGVLRVRGAEDDLVAGGEADLDRIDDTVLGPRGELEHVANRLGCMFARDPVLHLGELDPPLAGEDAKRLVDLGRATGAAGGEAGEARAQRGQVAPGKREAAANPVLERHLLRVDECRRARLRRFVGTPALATQRDLCVGEDVELEMVGTGVELVEVGEHVAERLRAVDAVEREGWDRADRHRVDQPERPEPEARAVERRPVGVGGDLERAAVGENEVDGLDLCGNTAEPRPGAVGTGRDRAGQRLVVDVAEVLEGEPEMVELAVELAEHDPGLDFDEPARAVHSQHPIEAVEANHDVVGESDVGERMTRGRGANPLVARRGTADDLGELVAGRRSLDHSRGAALIARPVVPPRRHRAEAIRQTDRARKAVPFQEGWQSG